VDIHTGAGTNTVAVVSSAWLGGPAGNVTVAATPGDPVDVVLDDSASTVLRTLNLSRGSP
jgi:hypothetical protein